MALVSRSFPPPHRVRWGVVGLFAGTAIALAWLVVLPLWVSGGLRNPLLPLVEYAMMLTPAIAALVTTFVLVKPAHPALFLGLAPLRPAGRLMRFLAIAVLGPPVIAFAALGLGAATGTVHVGFALDAYTPANMHTPQPIPAGHTLLALIILAAVPLSSLAGAIPALGEELGWRGLLLPALRPLGPWPALILTGTIWGVWHAPIILLGFEYDRPSPVGVVYMVVLSVLVGALIGWLRMRSTSIWPCALAHGAFNAAQSSILLVLIFRPHTGILTPLVGWTGWLVLLAAIAILQLTHQYRWADTSQHTHAVTAEQ